ncbi:MAG: hypothetical protein AB8B96_09490 [Lysobacterales bacterium]
MGEADDEKMGAVQKMGHASRGSRAATPTTHVGLRKIYGVAQAIALVWHCKTLIVLFRVFLPQSISTINPLGGLILGYNEPGRYTVGN